MERRVNRIRPILVIIAGTLAAALIWITPPSNIHAAESFDPFLKVLSAAYDVSCGDVDRLGDYYRSDAEIVHDGRITTLVETIKELKQTKESLPGLACDYRPNVRAGRIGAEIAYLLVRETIHISSKSSESRRYDQVCTYVFTKNGARWMIAHDHCSSIQGEMI